MRVLICRWTSLADGKATSGDVLALDRVTEVLTAAVADAPVGQTSRSSRIGTDALRRPGSEEAA